MASVSFWVASNCCNIANEQWNSTVLLIANLNPYSVVVFEKSIGNNTQLY